VVTPVEFDSDLIFYKTGRDALLAGLELLDIKPDSIILIPEYMCDPTIEPLCEREYSLVYMDIKDTLSLNLATLEECIKKFSVK